MVCNLFHTKFSLDLPIKNILQLILWKIVVFETLKKNEVICHFILGSYTEKSMHNNSF